MAAASKSARNIAAEPSADTESDRSFQLSDLPMGAGYGAALIMTGFASIIAAGLESVATIPNLSLVYVLPVILAAVLFGLGPALASSVLGALSFNYFFTEPRWTLQVDDPANIWAIGLLFAVGCIASAVAATAQRRAAEAERRRRQAEILQALSRAVTLAGDQRAAISAALDAAMSLFSVPTTLMVLTDGRVETLSSRGGIEPGDAELDAARSSLTWARFTPAGTYPFDNSRFDFWPAATMGLSLTIGFAFEPGERPEDAAALVETLAGLLLLALVSQRVAHASSSSIS